MLQSREEENVFLVCVALIVGLLTIIGMLVKFFLFDTPNYIITKK